MSKALAASCVAGVVTVGGLPLAGATVFSEGVAPSEGVVILDGDLAFYLSKESGDLKTTLDKLSQTLAQVKTALDQTVSALNQAATAFTTVDAKPTGGSGSAVVPTVVANVAAIGTATASITTAATALQTIKTAVDTLMGAMV